MEYLNFLIQYKEGNGLRNKFLQDCAKGFYALESPGSLRVDSRRRNIGIPPEAIKQIPIPSILSIYAGASEYLTEQDLKLKSVSGLGILKEFFQTAYGKHPQAIRALSLYGPQVSPEQLEDVKLTPKIENQLVKNIRGVKLDSGLVEVLCHIGNLGQLGISLFILQLDDKLVKACS